MNNIKIISSIGKRAAVLCAFLLFCLPQCIAQVQRGKASYYHHRFHGKRMSSGTHYHRDSLYCAHRTYPFGTPLKVTNVKNGKWTVVKVVDRGPHVRGRIIDLSYAAAKDIDMVRAGTATVEVEKIDSLTYIRLTAEPPQIPDSVLCRDSLPQ
jgi:rare lipoprotein A